MEKTLYKNDICTNPSLCPSTFSEYAVYCSFLIILNSTTLGTFKYIQNKNDEFHSHLSWVFLWNQYSQVLKALVELVFHSHPLFHCFQ